MLLVVVVDDVVDGAAGDHASPLVVAPPTSPPLDVLAVPLVVSLAAPHDVVAVSVVVGVVVSVVVVDVDDVDDVGHVAHIVLVDYTRCDVDATCVVADASACITLDVADVADHVVYHGLIHALLA
jgi:hypothetical protein